MAPRNERQGISIKTPQTGAERAYVARHACGVLNLSIPCVVDGMGDEVNNAYSAWPDRLYVVDRDGNIAVAGGRGPGGFAPAVEAVRVWLEGNAGRP